MAGDAFQCRPATGRSKFCSDGVGLDHQAGLAGIGHVVGIADQEIGPQGFAMLGNGGLDRGRDRLALGQHFAGQPEGLRQDELDPGVVDRLARPAALLVLLPLVVGGAQHPGLFRVVGIEAGGEDPLQHGHRQERPGDLDQRKPFGMMTLIGHLPSSQGPSTSQPPGTSAAADRRSGL